MIRWIVGSSLRLRFLIVIIAAVLMVFGIIQLRQMPVDVYPEFNPPMVEVQTEALGLSAAEMEALITVPLEADLLNGVAWLDQIYSESVAGMSSILLVFEPGTDPIRARQMVQERLTQTFALPNVSSPPTMLQPLSTTSRVMMVGLSSKDISLLEMGVLARWTVKPRLMGVPGVANVAIWGHRDRQLQVLVDPEKLAEKGVTLDQIIESTGESMWVSPLSYLESSSPGTAGWIDTPNQRLTIQHELPISSAQDLAQISIVGTEGVLLGDVAKVVEDHQPLIGDAAVSDGPGLLLVIEKFPGANTLEVTRGVEEALAAMAPGLKGVEINSSIYRPANYIESAIANLNMAIIIGAILVIVVLGLFFFNWRLVVVSLFTIPLSLIVATYILYVRGETFNVMILAGLMLALVVVIDDAITDVEHVAQRVRDHRQSGRSSVMGVVFDAVVEVRSPLVFAVLIILAAVVPLFFIPGLAGSFLRPFAVSYVLALLVAVGVALIVTPALSLLLMESTPVERVESPFKVRLQRVYSQLLQRLSKTPRLAYLIAAVVILLGVFTLPLMDVNLIPSFQRSHLLIDWRAAPGTSRAEMNRIMTKARAELSSIPGVTNIGTQIGRAITGDSVVGINSGQIWLGLDPDMDHAATIAAIQEVIDGYPGMFPHVQTYQPSRTAEALTGAAHDLVVRVFGTDLPELYAQAEIVQQRVAAIDGVADAHTDKLTEEPQVEIEVNLATAERYQIKPGDVRRQATTLLSGLRVGNLYEENKVFDVVVWGVPEIRNSLSDINQLQIMTPQGLVPLGELAEVRIVPSPVVIKRDVVSRFVDVTVDVSGRDVGAVAADIRSQLQLLDFPLEYHAEVVGLSSGDFDVQQRMINIGIAAVFGILLLLQASFDSWRLAFGSLLTLPVALAGGAIAALIAGGSLSLGSLFGFLAILAIAVRQLVLTVIQLQGMGRKDGEKFAFDMILRGMQHRMVPIAATTLSAIGVLLPLIVLSNRAGYEVLQPMSIVILGGLITSALFNLFIVPMLYLRVGVGRTVESPQPVTTLAPGVGGGSD